jgi:hypothetical protein
MGHPEVACQVDAWVRGVGLVAVRHAGADARDAIEYASVRLGREIRRRLAGLTPPAWPRKGGGGTAPAEGGATGRCSAAFGGQCGAWLAERTWEDDGGGNAAVTEPGPASPRRYAVKSEARRNDRTATRRRHSADRRCPSALAHAGD